MTLPILEAASRKALLTQSGRRVVRDAAAAHRALGPAASRATRSLSASDLARVARLVASLRRQPVRWSWSER